MYASSACDSRGCSSGRRYSGSQKSSQTRPTAPVRMKAHCQPKWSAIQGTVSGATIAPTLEPELKMPVASARSFFGNHSATVLIAAGKLPASPSPRSRAGDSELKRRAAPARRHAGDAPDRHRDGIARPGADPVDQPAREEQPDRVGRAEGGDDVAVVELGPADDLLEVLGEDADHLAVDVVDRGARRRAARRSPSGSCRRRSTAPGASVASASLHVRCGPCSLAKGDSPIGCDSGERRGVEERQVVVDPVHFGPGLLPPAGDVEVVVEQLPADLLDGAARRWRSGRRRRRSGRASAGRARCGCSTLITGTIASP